MTAIGMLAKIMEANPDEINISPVIIKVNGIAK
ncbi:hypothetical protein H336_23020 [Vibrio parahaemolyticus EN9701072]|nr:hypothetical protein H336_23020 [Vibrio parahaemolyticus EN9701072]